MELPNTQSTGFDAPFHSTSEEELVLAISDFNPNIYKATGPAPDAAELSTAWTYAIQKGLEASITGDLSIVEQTFAKQPDVPAGKLI